MLDSTTRDNVATNPSRQGFNISNPKKKRGKGGAGTLYSPQARAAHEEARKTNAKAEEERVAAFQRREQQKQHLANMRHRDGR